MARKSREVRAALVVAVAAQLVSNGCGPDITEVRRCVDSQGQILPDAYCDNPYYYSPGYGGIYFRGRPSYVYGGGGVSYVGGYASGYRSVPTDGARVMSSSGVELGHASGGSIVRGGFGHSSFGRSGGFGG